MIPGRDEERCPVGRAAFISAWVSCRQGRLPEGGGWERRGGRLGNGRTGGVVVPRTQEFKGLLSPVAHPSRSPWKWLMLQFKGWVCVG